MSGGTANFSVPASVFSLGIRIEDGSYHRPPTTASGLISRISGQGVDLAPGREPREGIDENDLAEAGWGVLWGDEAAREALKPLLELRREQAGAARFHEYTYQEGQSAQAFLGTTGAGPGPANPAGAAPYYLTIVGGPDKIPFDFQQELDVRYAVGRIAFDRLDDYARYAKAVVAAERRELERPRHAVFFGVEHADDPVTHLSTSRLVAPLASALEWDPGWRSRRVLGEAANRAALGEILRSDERPALLVTAGHALVLPSGHPHQARYQGSLLTADWPGPAAGGRAMSPTDVFSADDLGERSDVEGMIALLVGCFTGGTPRFDGFAAARDVELASKPFVAEFPKQLLARGALAAFAHVDSLYIHSFTWPGAAPGEQHLTFEGLLLRLLRGDRLGHAMDTFGRRYGELAERLLSARLDRRKISEEEYAAYWIGYHDARQYVVLGDPAVRLAVADAS